MRLYTHTHTPSIQLINGDCLKALKDIPDASIDLVVTDCPYHIVSGGCSKGAYGNGNGIFTKNHEPSGIFNRRRIAYKKSGGYILEGTKHIALGGVLDDNDSTTYARQGKLFKHNDIKFSEWLPEVYRVLKDGTHAYIYINAIKIIFDVNFITIHIFYIFNIANISNCFFNATRFSKRVKILRKQ